MTNLSLAFYFYILSVLLYGTYCAPCLQEFKTIPQEMCKTSAAISTITPEDISFAADLALKDEDEESLDDEYEDVVEINHNSQGVRSKKQTKLWDHWGKWSACSVSCGVGKMTRWRHCISEGCALGEKEAQIKTCSEQPC